MTSFNFNPTHTKYTRKEKENSKRMNIFFKYEYFMKEAKKAKADYLECKGKNPIKLDDKNRIALAELIVIFKQDALNYWNKSEELKKQYSFLNEMIRLKK